MAASRADSFVVRARAPGLTYGDTSNVDVAVVESIGSKLKLHSFHKNVAHVGSSDERILQRSQLCGDHFDNVTAFYPFYIRVAEGVGYLICVTPKLDQMAVFRAVLILSRCNGEQLSENAR